MIVLDGVCFGYSRDCEILSGIDLELGSGLCLLVAPSFQREA